VEEVVQHQDHLELIQEDQVEVVQEVVDLQQLELQHKLMHQDSQLQDLVMQEEVEVQMQKDQVEVVEQVE
jgi:hypothetical protein